MRLLLGSVDHSLVASLVVALRISRGPTKDVEWREETLASTLCDMLEQFSRFNFDHNGVSHAVFRAGEGPPVIVIHEIPGVTPEVADFAERTVAEGFTVFMPELFGTTGKPFSNGYVAARLAKVCISREFHVMASRSSSPVTTWLRELSREIHEGMGGPGVGVVGMCLTGNFALAMMVDPWVMAPVLSQPSLPFPVGEKRKRALHVSSQDLAVAKQRAVDEGRCLIGLRFSDDATCPPERFESLREEFGDNFEGIEIDSGPGNPAGFARSAHSVLTTEFLDEDGHPTKQANDRVMRFLHENLGDRLDDTEGPGKPG